jgi:putative ABC transport system permease protein
MLGIIATNLLRRPARTVFTASGIAVGIAMIVALLAFTAGLQRTAAGFVHLGGSGLGVFQANVSDPTASLLPEALVGRLAADPDVAKATPLLLIVEGVKDAPAAIVFGAEPHGFFAQQLVIVAGARPAEGGRGGGGVGFARSAPAAGTAGATGSSGGAEILVGERLAAQSHLQPGGSLTVSGRRFRVSGIYHSGVLFEDSGAVLALGVAQQLAGRAGEETDVVVQLTSGAHAATVAATIERALPGTQVIADPQQALRAGANGTLISKAILVIVVIALILGALSVINTMAMSIIERQSELGLLSTIGWSPLRVATLILGEGVAVSVLGAAVGLLIGLIGSHLLVDALGVSAYISPVVTAWGLGRGLLVGVAIGMLGGIYPAWRVTRMAPLRALSVT